MKTTRDESGSSFLRVGDDTEARRLIYTSPSVRSPRTARCGRSNGNANMKCMPETPAQQLRGFIAKSDPAMGTLIRECRSVMRKRFPTANELVYDNYNFFVIGY